ncbi:MAG: VWA domain-containing protein [Planctomycetaceae bacterium]|nr:VWA domain-containing protein [Planctomycetaceae bacterium]
MSDHRDQFDPEEEQAARLTAFALGELNEGEQKEVESELTPDQRETCHELQRMSLGLSRAEHAATLPEPSVELRAAIESKLSGDAIKVELKKPNRDYNARGRWLIVLSTGLLLLVAVVATSNLLNGDGSRSIAMQSEISQSKEQNASLQQKASPVGDRLVREQMIYRLEAIKAKTAARIRKNEELSGRGPSDASFTHSGPATEPIEVDGLEEMRLARQDRDKKFANVASLESRVREYKQVAPAPTTSPAPIVVTTEGARQPGTTTYQALPSAQPYSATPPAQSYVAEAGKGYGQAFGVQGVPAPTQLATDRYVKGMEVAGGYRGGQAAQSPSAEAKPGYYAGHHYNMDLDFEQLDQVRRQELTISEAISTGEAKGRGLSRLGSTAEQYSQIIENRFASVSDAPLSTFSIDVDTASYANTRRFLTQNQLPPANAIRIEEFVNYFTYDYPQPKENEPFSVNLEVAECPWQPAHQLVRIGLKGKDVPQETRPASNVVFLLDVSGSMQNANKLPLLKQAMKLLTDQLTESDSVSIVTYAGNAGLALDTTNGESKQTIRDAIDALNANGSTNGSAGIQLAYEKATESFIKGGANRVILATDGDLNVGVTDDDALIDLIKTKAASGVFLTVLGFGEGNLKDGKLEKLADNGNGMYAYIDSLREARKVLVEQIAGSLVTIAKDVKIKVEFNPAEVAAYRLLGYENRLMSAPDFDNDAKDAGEIGAGHTVTALYEIVPAKATEQLTSTAGSLKYQRPVTPVEPPKELTAAAETGELLTLFLRYKQPDADESTLREFTVESQRRAFDDASSDFRFAAAIASFGMVLRNSEFQGNSSLASVEEIASSAIGSDAQGHRTEFLDLVRKASTLQPQRR